MVCVKTKFSLYLSKTNIYECFEQEIIGEIFFSWSRQQDDLYLIYLWQWCFPTYVGKVNIKTQEEKLYIAQKAYFLMSIPSIQPHSLVDCLSVFEQSYFINKILLCKNFCVEIITITIHFLHTFNNGKISIPYDVKKT